MNCKQCQERLHDYLDETLEAAGRAEVGEHLAACEACRRELDALRKVAALVGSLEEVPEPAGLLQGVRARIDKPSAWERVRRLLTQPLRPGYSVAIPVLIVAFFAVFVVMMLPHKPTELADKPPSDGSEAALTELAYDVEEPALSEEESAGEFGYAKPAYKDGRKARDYANDRKVSDKLDTDDDSDSDEIERPDTEDFQSALRGSGAGDRTENGLLKGGDTGGLEKSVEAEEVEPELEEGEHLARRESGRALNVNAELERDKLSADAEPADEDTYARKSETNGEADEDKARLTEPDGRPREKTLADVANGPREPHSSRKADHIALGPRGVEGVWKDQTLKGEKVIELVVVDFQHDRSNVERIVAEEAGRVLEIRSKSNKLLDALVLEVPDKNYDNAVRRINMYNFGNQKVLQERQKPDQQKRMDDSPAVTTRGGPNTQQSIWNTPFRLIIRRIIQKTTPTDDDKTTEERQAE
jgi:hypothetical protein